MVEVTPRSDSALLFLQPGSFPAGLIHMVAAGRLYFFMSCCHVLLRLSKRGLSLLTEIKSKRA